MLVELAEELEAVRMFGEGGESLLCELVRLLELAELVCEQRAVVEGLKHLGREQLHSLEVGARRVDVALAQLQHSEVGV